MKGLFLGGLLGLVMGLVVAAVVWKSGSWGWAGGGAAGGLFLGFFGGAGGGSKGAAGAGTVGAGRARPAVPGQSSADAAYVPVYSRGVRRDPWLPGCLAQWLHRRQRLGDLGPLPPSAFRLPLEEGREDSIWVGDLVGVPP